MKAAGRGRAPAVLLLLTLLSLAGAHPAWAQVAPDAEWRTFDTEHFRVNHVAGLDTLARRAADRAERAYRLLAAKLSHAPSGRIDLTIADNVDLANGYATPIPSNRIVVYAHPPIDLPELAFYSDWVELVVLHELTHIFQLDRSEGIWRPLRSILGRDPLVFPELYSPSWVKEGIAVYYESLLTPAGRLGGTQHEMALRTAILGDEFFPIDRASSSPVQWPAGNTPYIYGAHFIDFLARQYGAERVPAFVDRSAHQLIPFLQDRAAEKAFGISFSGAWRAWQSALAEENRAQADSLRALGLTRPELLTSAGRQAAFPRYSPDGSTIAYAASTGREEASLELISADGSLHRLAPRTSLGPASWSRDGRALLFADLEFSDPYRRFSQLFRVSAEGGDAERVGSVERIWEVDLHPAGDRAVGVMNASGTNVLALFDPASGRARPITTPDLDVHWSLPRWSPDGDRIAVTRWSAGGFHDIVVLDTTGTVVRTLTHDRALDTAPAWSPDRRYLLFSSDRTGIPNLFAYDLQTGRLLQVTRVLTGAVQPDVSPDARWIAFSLYRADGYHIARIPYVPAEWHLAPPPSDSLLAPAVSVSGATLASTAGGPGRAYSAFPTLLPTSWLPLLGGGSDLGIGFGAAVTGEDAISRHLWGADAALYTNAARIQGGAAYLYRGLGNPTLGASLRQRWEVALASEAALGGEPGRAAVFRRERELQLSAKWLRQRMRSAAWLSAAAELEDLRYEWDRPPPAELADALSDPPPAIGGVVTGGYSTARRYPYSISPEEGFRISSGLEAHRYTRPFPTESTARSYLRSVSQARGYLPLPLGGFARHVLAGRLDLGLDRGRGSPGLEVGGAGGTGAALPGELGELGADLTFPIRGYPAGIQFGTTALTASAEYRFPLWLVQRGVRVLPLFLDRVSGDLFADAGTACLTGDCIRFAPGPSDDLLTSIGAEIVTTIQLGYGATIPLRLGIAQPLSNTGGSSPRFYLRIGNSF